MAIFAPPRAGSGYCSSELRGSSGSSRIIVEGLGSSILSSSISELIRRRQRGIGDKQTNIRTDRHTFRQIEIFLLDSIQVDAISSRSERARWETRTTMGDFFTTVAVRIWDDAGRLSEALYSHVISHPIPCRALEKLGLHCSMKTNSSILLVTVKDEAFPVFPAPLEYMDTS